MKSDNLITSKSYLFIMVAWLVLFTFSLTAYFLGIEFNQLINSNRALSVILTPLDNPSLFSLFLATESVSFPYGVITALVLVLLFSKLLKLSLKQSLILLVIIGITALVGLEIKSLIKRLTSEPRPYMLWLAHIAEPIKLNLDEYYQLIVKTDKQAELAQIMQQPVFESWQIPTWLKNHWIKDSEYSFPSGHTFFATLFALLSVGLFATGKNHQKWIAGFLLLWALAVMFSRLMLGMHRPIDLIGGTVIALICALMGIFLINRFVFKYQSDHKL